MSHIPKVPGAHFRESNRLLLAAAKVNAWLNKLVSVQSLATIFARLGAVLISGRRGVPAYLDLVSTIIAEEVAGRYQEEGGIVASRDDIDGPGFLPSIVADMPRKPTLIEIGFLSIIDHAAQHGWAAAERLVAHYERWGQNEASKKARRPRRPRRPKLTLVVNRATPRRSCRLPGSPARRRSGLFSCRVRWRAPEID
jgi:hypothetical protein